MDRFDGDPMNYWTFVRQYEAHVVKRVKDYETHLLLLLQHCEPKVRHKIDHLTAKAPSEGFQMACEILY